MVFKPEALDLFHGSLELKGGKIMIGSSIGVGWNALTLGNAFYTSVSVDAARLFSHLVLQKSRLKGEETFNNVGFAKIYKVLLHKDSSILDADKALDANRVRSILTRAGIPQRYLEHRNDDQLTDFYKSADLLCYGAGWEGNRNEYLTKALGFDGLLIQERAWDSYDYYPQDIGIDWEGSDITKGWPPKTLALYNPEVISGYELISDGRIYVPNKEVFILDIER